MFLINLCNHAEKHYVNPFFKPTKIHYLIRNIDLPTAQKIMSFTKKLLNNNSLMHINYALIENKIKNNFILVKKISWSYLPTKTLQCIIYGKKPLCILNDTFVVDNTGNVVNKEIFSSYHALPKMTVSESTIIKAKLNNSTYFFIRSILDKNDVNVIKKYHINYHSPWHITITPLRSILPCKIITNKRYFFKTQDEKTINNIFFLLFKKNILTKDIIDKKNGHIIFDIRQKNQIVVTYLNTSKKGRGV